jgi:predicted Rossmann fold flavoprotein
MVPTIKKVAIIGGGASGLTSAAYLSKHNLDITLFEQNSKIGRKLLATGNGRCNITNEDLSLQHFHTHGDISFIKTILNKFDLHRCENFFQTLGILFMKNEQGRFYPLSGSASSLVDAFEFELKQNGVKIQLNTFIENIEFLDDQQQFLLNKKELFDYIIIATGSIAMKKLGATSSGYEFAKQFSHTVIEPFASLVQLKSDNKYLDIIQGVKITGKIKDKVGDILFTKYGISGSTILDISREVVEQLQFKEKVKLSIDLLPNISKEKLISVLKERQKLLKNKEILTWLDGILHKKLSRYIILTLGLQEKAPLVNNLNFKQLQSIAFTIKNLPFSIIDSNGFENCEVCAGGVDISDINSKTMESNKQKNLFFTGEVLDVDGDCGGYNLHFAWASGYSAAKTIIDKNLKSQCS